jgi:hypothetical protein
VRRSTTKFFLAAQCLYLALPVLADTELTLAQARALAADSVQRDPGLAAQLARGVLKGQPEDGVSHYILATAYSRLNQPDDGRKSARKAFRYGQTNEQKFEAAQLAARMSFQGDRPTLAQLWLRRAANHAPNEQAEAVVASDYKRLRQINPWSFRLNGGFTPTDNLNNGTENDYLVVDGVADGGVIVGGQQPLSGIEAHINAQVNYRLRASKTSATTWNAQLYVKRVRLSDEARAIAPTRANSDFAYTYFDTGLRHAFAIGEAGTTASVSGSIGQTWSTGNSYTRFFRVKGDVTYKLSGSTSLTLDTSFDRQNRLSNSALDTTTLGFGAQIRHKRTNGDIAGLGIYIRDTSSDTPNRDNDYVAIRASYALGKPVGPVSISAGVTFSQRNYDQFLVGFPAVNVNRKDDGLSADMTFVFNDVSYAGFVPSLTVRARSTQSNVNLFETKGLSVSMGIRSKF